MHLHAALAVTYVAHLLACDFIDVGEEGREVEIGHMLETEFPEQFVFVWVVFGVVAGVLVAAVVAQPHVEPSVGEHEGWGLVLVVDEPGVETVDQAVLEEDGAQSVRCHIPMHGFW